MLAFEKSVGAVVFRRRGENTIMYLLLHYPGGHWDFPRGHAEKGETEEGTLAREVREETGINDLKIIPVFKGKIRYFYRAKEEEKVERKNLGKNTNIFKRVVYYLAETETKNVKISDEHTGYEWLGYGDALSRITYKNGKAILKRADAFLKKIPSGL